MNDETTDELRLSQYVWCELTALPLAHQLADFFGDVLAGRGVPPVYLYTSYHYFSFIPLVSF